MSQQIWNEIIPTTTSGNQLATLLNNFKDAIVSGLSGTSRPSQLQAGGYWIDTTDDATGLWYFKIYTGSQDITIFTINKNTGSASVFSTDSQFEIFKSSDDTDGPILKFLKERVAGSQTLEGDSIGDIEFTGTRDDGQEAVQGRITVVSTDPVTAGAKGAYMAIELTPDGTATPVEVARIVDSQLGIGLSTPTEKLHVNGNIKGYNESDTTTPSQFILRKKRISLAGQVVNGDSLGKLTINSTDNNGDEFEAGNIEYSASQTHTATARGTSVKIRNTLVGATAPSDAISLTDDVTINRAQTNVTNLTASGNIGAAALQNTSIENPTRLDPKRDTESALVTYAATANDGELVYSTDTNSFFVITGGELVPAGGGGGGTSLIWEKNSSLAPLTEYVDGIKVQSFDDESEQEIYATIPVPASYRAGKPITLKNGVYACASTTGNVLFQAETKLIREGQTVLGALGVSHVSTNAEKTVPTTASEIDYIGDVDLTTAGGQINAVSIAAGDKLLVKLVRKNSQETSSALELAKLLINSFEISFS